MKIDRTREPLQLQRQIFSSPSGMNLNSTINLNYKTISNKIQLIITLPIIKSSHLCHIAYQREYVLEYFCTIYFL